MSDIQLYLLEYEKNKSDAQNIASESAAKLERKELKLIALITSLEEYINNKDDATIRARSVSYLADVLEKLPPKVLSGQERRLLCDFILGRIEGDLEGVGASSRALISLESLGKWDSETAQNVVKTYLAHASPLRQFKLQMERFAIVQLFDVLVAKYRHAMQQLHESDAEFMSTFVSFFEGEKDPRNLMIIFSILHVPMAEWNIQKDAQDLFEAVFNYFPITFKPPPDDPYGITAQDLKDRLRDCISSNSDFATYSVSALLDKLDSTSMNTKRDVLHTIQSCITGYGPQTINLYSVTLWDALKFEILNVQEEDLAEEALKALALIGAELSSSDGALNTYVRPVVKECNEHIEDAPTKQSHAAGRILHSIAASAGPVADKIAKGILPALFTLYNASDSITKRRGLLEIFNQIVKAYVELNVRRVDGTNIETLKASMPDALEAIFRAIINAPKSEVSFRLIALDSLNQLLAVPKLLSEKEIYRVVDTVTDIILHEHIDGHGDIRSNAIKCLTEIARNAPDAVRSQAIPAFMVRLPDKPVEGDDVEQVLEAFAQLSTEQQVFDTVVLRLKNKLNAARSQNAPGSYQHSLLLATLYAFTRGSPMKEDGIIRSSYFGDYAAPLMAYVRDAVHSEPNNATFEIIGRLCNIILRPQTLHFQASVYNENLEWLSPAHGAKIPQDEVGRLAPFSLHYYAALQAEIVDAADIVSLLQAQAAFVLSTTSRPLSTSIVMRHIALLVNKFVNPRAMKPTLENAQIEVEALLQNETNSSQTTALAFCITKALIVQGKGAKLTSAYLDLLLQRLASATDAPDAAMNFATLLAPDDILTRENHCLVSPLATQKTFAQTVPALVEAIRSASPATKPNYLVALGGILRCIPYSMLQPSLSTLVAPLLQTLDLSPATTPAAPAVKASALSIFEAALTQDPDTVAEHAASLITRLLNCTASAHPTTTTTQPTPATPETGNSATVRAKALQSLALVPRRLRPTLVLPFRRQVVKRLLACLDDGRRRVRAEAVRCRTAWLAVEEEEEAD